MSEYYNIRSESEPVFILNLVVSVTFVTACQQIFGSILARHGSRLPSLFPVRQHGIFVVQSNGVFVVQSNGVFVLQSVEPTRWT